ncbi:PfkB family carbohydrate kinase [Shewanella salipaludis]|uniref:Ribokinase n=1 Tax=Shewanella salipaludis TaxID=2723052 RepID=A0A972FUX1_9GAMM|nr:PfkB family carbohydrate kinase [Shewanella salipaludis]NMH66206.1 ribokinase [Shewanella salipaludis]
MANIILLANLNCDRILLLDKPLESGGRFHYQDGGQRLGGGGANSGIGLVWAGHRVALVSQVGRDALGDWLLAEAGNQGLDCRLVQRHGGNSSEMLLLMTPDGERTIVRPQRPKFVLPAAPEWTLWDALYINSSAEGAADWARDALEHCLVLAQLAKDDRPRPCHILLTSGSDIQGRCGASLWDYGVGIAGDELKYFIVTDGVNGASLYQATGVERLPAVSTLVLDTTGAGDAYASGLLHGLCSGMAILESMAEAAHWAACAVASVSSVPGPELQHYLRKQG